MVDKTRMQLQKAKNDLRQTSRTETWPAHWRDIVHDLDGGNDMFGRRPQDGRAKLKEALAKLAYHDSGHYAEDDVTGVELDPQIG